MNWIRIDRGIGRDVAILRMARQLDVCRAEVVGLVVNVLAQVPDHAPTGDISTLDDADVELWADWQRGPGLFAAAFRAHLCTDAGVIRSWEKHNGAAMRDAAASRDRAKAYREKRKAERTANANVTETRTRDVTRTVRRTSREPNALRHVLRDETRRNRNTEIFADTEISAQSTHHAKATKSASSDAAKFPHWPVEDRNAKHAHWQAELGPVGFGLFVATLGPIFNGTALASCTDQERQQAFSSYVSSAKAGGNGSRFVSPAQCAKVFGAIVQAWRDFADDPVGRIARIDTIVHGRPLT